MNGSSTVSNAIDGKPPTPSKALSASRCCSCVGTLTGYTVSHPSTRTINRKINGNERIERTKKIESDNDDNSLIDDREKKCKEHQREGCFVAKEFRICIRTKWNELLAQKTLVDVLVKVDCCHDKSSGRTNTQHPIHVGLHVCLSVCTHASMFTCMHV